MLLVVNPDWPALFSPRARVTTLFMDSAWLSEEVRLWNTIMDPGSPALARFARKVERMPAGKHKAKLLDQISKARKSNFAAGWSAFHKLVDNHPRAMLS